MADPNTRQGKRTPVTLKIKFKSETLEQFIERYAVDVSQGGIFIRTKEPLAVGTQMKFEFQLRDASPLIAGEGTVVWTRENDPSRPAIAPGMGVRFDRLADGSQSVLEKILAEKAKQAPSRSQTETAPGQNKQQMFAEVPTRVAPAPVQEALGLRSRTDSEQTPLPKPMPFHSDADDFDEKAFEEATKVRSLDDLAAESARDGNEEEDDGSGLSDSPKNATVVMPADELLARRRVTAEGIAIPEEPKRDSAERAAMKSVPDRESAPGLPSPPIVEGPRAARVDSTPPPRSEPSTPPPMSASSSGSTKLGMEPAKAMTAADAASEAAPRAIAAEPSRPVAPSRPSSAPIIIGIALAVAASIGLVWFFVLRDNGESQVADTTKPDPGSAVAPGSNTVTPPEPGSAVAITEPGSAGSAADTGSAGSAAVMPEGPTADTVIASSVKGATVEITGTDMKGPAPFTAKLAKDKVFKVLVTAPGYLPAEIEIKGGEKATAKPQLKPRVLSVTTEPAGADIYVDNYNTQKITPSEVQLTAAQAARARVRISLRRPGYRPVDQIVEKGAFKDEETRATHSITVTLTKQATVRPRPDAGSTGTGTGTDSGSGAGTTSGSGATGTGGTTSDTKTGSATTPAPTPPPAPTPAPAPAPAPSAGSAAPSGGQTLK